MRIYYLKVYLVKKNLELSKEIGKHNLYKERKTWQEKLSMGMTQMLDLAKMSMHLRRKNKALWGKSK